MPDRVVDWLLEESQPSIRYLTLKELLGKPENDPDVRATKELLATRGWAADILSRQDSGGWWYSEKSLYRPKYLSTMWMLPILSDLGLTREEPRVRKACELWMQRLAKKDGGFSTDLARISEMCITGNTARVLIKFGYVEHPRVKIALEWLLKDQKENGGWRCGWRNGVIDGWEPLSVFIAYPRKKWTKSIKSAVERGAEFYLTRELHKEGKRYEPWYRFHYPIHYYYDLLVGLDLMTALGYGGDRRLSYAVSLLKKKRRPDGRWNLDAVHPDLESFIAEWYARRPPVPFTLEEVGKPSKMITFLALRVLNRLDS